jgi:hypothetical protein
MQNFSYKTGTYLLISRKPWPCECCKKIMPVGETVFTRIECFGPEKKNRHGETYQLKNYERYHQECALGLPNLSVYEKELLKEFFKHLPQQTEPVKDSACI